MICDRIKKVLKHLSKGRKKFGQTTETMEGFCFLISATGLNRPDTRKGDDLVRSYKQRKHE
jgi:hypothetical protein